MAFLLKQITTKSIITYKFSSSTLFNKSIRNFCAIENNIEDKIKPSISVVQHPYSLSLEPINPSLPILPEERFAIIEFSGTQYKVTLDDLVVADKIKDVDIGDRIVLDKVLLVGSKRSTTVGRPLIPNAQVIAYVEEIAKDKKVIAMKTRRRKNSKSTVGHRRQVTVLRISEININKEDENLGLNSN